MFIGLNRVFTLTIQAQTENFRLRSFSRGAMMLCCLLLFFCVSLKAQKSDTVSAANTKTKSDTALHLQHVHSPKKAALLSAVLPGAGQVYNGKWWKVPIIYAGFGGLGYMLQLNQDSVNRLNSGIRERVNDTLPSWNDYLRYPGYSTDQLITIKRFYQRYRDMAVLGIGLVYMLNVVDATVDAHLKSFDVSDNLTMRVRPRVLMAPGGNLYTACTLSLSLH